MIYKILSDSIVVIHLAFILFVCLGAFLVFKWPGILWIHLPCAIWGAILEFFNLICPLTPLENYFRKLSGIPEYHSGFIDHYILPIIYPDSLTPEKQMIFGLFVVIINVLVYGLIILKKFKSKH